jgi:three-Cys-motif partner protein
MVATHYDWEIGGALPTLQRHSSVKHGLLRDYLVEYFLTLVSSPHQDHIKLTIVDGFCGGGRYADEDSGKEAPGSPIVILKAIKEAEFRIVSQQQRKKPIHFDVELICIDEDMGALNHLKWVLDEEGYGDKLEKEEIRLLHGTFESHAETVINRAKERSRISGKAIFVLDQYGYSEVPSNRLKTICTGLSKAEVILTFNVDSLINYLSFENLNNYKKKTGSEKIPPTGEKLFSRGCMRTS